MSDKDSHGFLKSWASNGEDDSMDVMLRLIQIRDPKAALKALVKRLRKHELSQELQVMYGKLRLAIDRGKTKQAIEEAGILLDKLQQNSVQMVESILRDMDKAKSFLLRIKDSAQFLTQLSVSILTIVLLTRQVVG
jgi:hypothetical protein